MMSQRLERFIFRYCSGNPAEYCVPPGSECRLEFGEPDEGRPMFTATTYNNDGHEVWIAYTRGRWLVHFGRKEAIRLAWFILWDWWIVATWCGLKRRLWYWSLRRQAKRMGVGIAGGILKGIKQ